MKKKSSNSLASIVILSALFTLLIAATYGFGIYLFPALIPDMRTTLGFSYGEAGIATAGGQIGFLIAALAVNFLVKRLGSGWVLCISIATCALGLFGMYLVPNIWVVVLWLTTLGATAALAYTPMVEICQQFIPARHRGKVLCLISSGTSYGVFINGLIVNRGWRDVWLIVAFSTTALTIAALAFLYFNNMLSESRRTYYPDRGSSSFLRYRLALAAERRVSMIWLLMFINGFAGLSFQTYFSPYLRDELGYSASFAGSLWSIIGLVGMGGGLMMGVLADRLSLRFVMGISYLFIGIASVTLLKHTAQNLLYLAAVTFSLGFYAIFGLAPAYISQTVDKNQSTFVFAIGNIMLATGAMIGNYIGGWMRTMLDTFAWTYILITFLACASLIILPALPRERRKSKHEAYNSTGDENEKDGKR